MSQPIEADYNQSFLFPPRLDDWVGERHPARFIRQVVEELDLAAAGIVGSEGEAGRPHYGARLLLKVWLYGFFHKVRSTRGLERLCANDVGLLWLAGLHRPDHNTLWRFFRTNRAALEGVFGQVVRLAMGMELVDLALGALDGTKIVADVQRDGAWHRPELLQQLAKVEEAIQEITAKIAAGEAAEGAYELPAEVAAELADREAGRERIRQGLAELAAAGTDHLSRTDEAARMMPSGGRKEFGYNAQSLVDGQAGIVVAADVVTEANDSHQLTRMIAAGAAVTGQAAAGTVADGGYYAGAEVAEAMDRGYEVVVPVREGSSERKQGRFHLTRFVYEAETDTYRCPLGGQLVAAGTSRSRRGAAADRVYECRSWRTCAAHGQCTRSREGRRIKITPYRAEADRRQQRAAQDRVWLKRRLGLVEPVFGFIKHILGFRRWTVRGPINVRAQWFLLCTTVNLHKMFRHWAPPRTRAPGDAGGACWVPAG